ncbi:DUF6463 family protein [Spirillospora sp. NPDC029432]|uniref:DUF6463 family protein n=1 Tax=Spirillospora sp. NPDC029432 TaxID=3154599 RepID=UPI0034525A78
MNAITRWTPWGIIALACVHTVYAFATMPGAWGDIARAGVLDGIQGDAEREVALWFLYSGVGFMAIGTFALKEVRATGRVPLQAALYLLAVGGTMSAVMPASGGWLVLLLGLLALAARRRDRATEGG